MAGVFFELDLGAGAELGFSLVDMKEREEICKCWLGSPHYRP